MLNTGLLNLPELGWSLAVLVVLDSCLAVQSVPTWSATHSRQQETTPQDYAWRAFCDQCGRRLDKQLRRRYGAFPFISRRYQARTQGCCFTHRSPKQKNTGGKTDHPSWAGTRGCMNRLSLNRELFPLSFSRGGFGVPRRAFSTPNERSLSSLRINEITNNISHAMDAHNALNWCILMTKLARYGHGSIDERSCLCHWYSLCNLGAVVPGKSKEFTTSHRPSQGPSVSCHES